MRILSVILLLVLTYFAVDSLFLSSNKVQKTPELISDDFDEKNTQVAYNKSALLVRKKRLAALTVTVLATIGVQYICLVLLNITPFDDALKRWALKFWGFREGHEAGRWKELAKLVQRNVPLDADGNIDEEEGIRDFSDAPAEMENKLEDFRQEATLTVAKIMEDEVRHGTSTFSSKIEKWEDLDQVTKAMMADNMIDTLIGINGTGETTWKVNPKKQEHRKIYEDLKKIKEAIDRKYKGQCKLKPKITAKELPKLKAWYVRLLGAVPEWFSNVFKGVKEAKQEEIKIDKNVAKKIDDIHAMAETVLEAAETVKKEKQNKMKLGPDSINIETSLNSKQIETSKAHVSDRHQSTTHPLDTSPVGV